MGALIRYDSGGVILSETPAPRSVGTTVVLGNLFHSLPVRRKQFEKNLKREFAKMTHVLTAYCIISTGVRYTLEYTFSHLLRHLEMKPNMPLAFSEYHAQTLPTRPRNVHVPALFQRAVENLQLLKIQLSRYSVLDVSRPWSKLRPSLPLRTIWRSTTSTLPRVTSTA